MEKVTSDKVMGDELDGRSLKNYKDRRQESEFRSQKLRITRFESFKRDWICHGGTENTERRIPKSMFQVPEKHSIRWKVMEGY